nr:hypothetical protein [Nostocaceae cyanobacterium]
LLGLETTQLIDTSPEAVSVIKKISDRKDAVLSEVDDTSESIKLLRQGDHILQVKTEHMDQASQFSLKPKAASKRKSKSKQEDWDVRKRELFDVQMNLLLLKLHKLQQNGNNPEIENLIIEVEKHVNRDISQEMRDGGARAEQIDLESHILPPSDH